MDMSYSFTHRRAVRAMLVADEELQEVEEFLRHGAENILQDPDDRLLTDNVYFCQRLHLLLACGFDEVRYQYPFREELNPYGWPALRDLPILPQRGEVRETASGAWYRVLFGSEPVVDHTGHVITYRPPNAVLFPEPLPESGLAFHQAIVNRRFIPLPDVISACRRLTDDPSAVLFAPLWQRLSPHASIELVDTTKALLQALRGESLSLSDITWSQLEDIVGELFRARGLDVHVTRRSADGGRDIIARGELIPGEPTLLAVEVKHKPVVGVADVRQALWANRRFPVVMVATSGRFTGGVVQERRDPDNQLRLVLKDGVALSQWIQSYRGGA